MKSQLCLLALLLLAVSASWGQCVPHFDPILGAMTCPPSAGSAGPTGPTGPTGPSGAVAPGGNVTAYTTDHTLNSGDCGNWLTFNGSSLTFTLASPPPSAACSVAVQNLGSSTLTVSRNGLTINGAASNVTLAAISGVTAVELSVWTDGTNYFASQGPPGAAGSTGPTGPTGPPGSGSIAATTSTLKGDGAGAAVAVTGTGTNCVLVNGSSGSCGSGGTAYIDYQGATGTITGNQTVYSTSIPSIPAGKCIRASAKIKSVNLVASPLYDICFGASCAGGYIGQPASGTYSAVEFEVCNDPAVQNAQHVNAICFYSHLSGVTTVSCFDAPVAAAENTASAVTLSLTTVSGGGTSTVQGIWWHVWGPM